MNKIIIDGKEYELSAELVEKIKAEVAEQEKAENPFEINVDDHYRYYYFIDACGEVSSFIDTRSRTDKAFYSAGNYCRDKGMMEQRALHETLNRLLWRYRETHGGDPAWTIGEYPEFVHHYEICYDYSCKVFRTASVVNGKGGGIYFKDKKTAEAAIEEVVKPFIAAHPEFVW